MICQPKAWYGKLIEMENSRFLELLAYHSICLVNTNWSHLVLLQPLLEINVCGACSLQWRLLPPETDCEKELGLHFLFPNAHTFSFAHHLLSLGFITLTLLTHTALCMAVHYSLGAYSLNT